MGKSAELWCIEVFIYRCNSRRWVRSSICLSGCATRWLRSRRTAQPCLRPSRTWAGSFSAVRLWPPPCESRPPALPTSLLPSPASVCPSRTPVRGEAPIPASSETTPPAPGHRGRARGPRQGTSALNLPWWSANAEKFNCLSQKNCFCFSLSLRKNSEKVKVYTPRVGRAHAHATGSLLRNTYIPRGSTYKYALFHNFTATTLLIISLL